MARSLSALVCTLVLVVLVLSPCSLRSVEGRARRLRSRGRLQSKAIVAGAYFYPLKAGAAQTVNSFPFTDDVETKLTAFVTLARAHCNEAPRKVVGDVAVKCMLGVAKYSADNADHYLYAASNYGVRFEACLNWLKVNGPDEHSKYLSAAHSFIAGGAADPEPLQTALTNTYPEAKRLDNAANCIKSKGPDQKGQNKCKEGPLLDTRTKSLVLTRDDPNDGWVLDKGDGCPAVSTAAGRCAGAQLLIHAKKNRIVLTAIAERNYNQAVSVRNNLGACVAYADDTFVPSCSGCQVFWGYIPNPPPLN